VSGGLAVGKKERMANRKARAVSDDLRRKRLWVGSVFHTTLHEFVDSPNYFSILSFFLRLKINL